MLLPDEIEITKRSILIDMYKNSMSAMSPIFNPNDVFRRTEITTVNGNEALNLLIEDGLVKKDGTGYGITEKGVKTVTDYVLKDNGIGVSKSTLNNEVSSSGNNSNDLNKQDTLISLTKEISASEIKREMFPEATVDDWLILGKWFSELEVKKQERSILVGVAKKYCPNETAREVAEICNRFRNIPANLQNNEDVIYLELVYKMLVDENFQPLTESTFWFPYLEEVYYQQQTKNTRPVNANASFEIGDLKNKIMKVWAKKNNPKYAPIKINELNVDSLIITHLLSPHPNDTQLMVWLDNSSIRKKMSPQDWQEDFLSRWFFNYIASGKQEAKKLGKNIDLPSKNYKMSHHIHSDIWASEDLLGYKIFATAIAEFIKHKNTDVPITIGIFAKWGLGKTSLMHFVLDEFKKNADKSKFESVFGFKRTEFPTIWINAWNCETTEQVWASLVNSIISQLTNQASFFKREFFWFKLWKSRFEEYKLKHDILSFFLVCLITISAMVVLKTVFFPFPFLLDFFSKLLREKRIYTPIIGIAFSGVTIWALSKWIFESLNGKKDVYMRFYDHNNKLNYFSIVEKDLKLAFDHFVDPEKPAIIFIDDLDRCSPKNTVTVIEALNHFLSGEFGECAIILGMDAHMVAGLLSSEYKELKDYILTNGFEGDSIGWSFMEKFIQLPFFMPRISKDKQLKYAEELFGIDEISKDKPVFSEQLNKPEKEVSNQNNIKASILIQKAIQVSLDDDPTISDLLMRHISWFYHSPRMVKRFVNILRFYQSIEDVKKAQNLPHATTDDLAFWLILALRWPQLIRWIQWGGKETTIQDSSPLIRAKHFGDLILKFNDTEFSKWYEAIKTEKLECVIPNSPRKLFEFLKSKPNLNLDVAIIYGIW